MKDLLLLLIITSLVTLALSQCYIIEYYKIIKSIT